MTSQLLTDYAKTVRLLSERPINSAESDSLAITIYETPSHRWTVEWTSTNIVDTKTQMAIAAFLDSIKYDSFTWQPPIVGEVNGSATTNPPVLNNAAAGSESIEISGTFAADFLVPGSIIKLDNDSKVYRVLNTVTGTNPTIQINAPLRKAITNANMVITQDVKLTLRLDPKSKPTAFERRAGTPATTFKAQFIEVL